MTLRLFLRKVISHLLFQREFPLSFGHMSFSTDVPYRHVIYKLLGFTLAMVVGPIGTYFLTVDTVFGGMFFSLIYMQRLTASGNSTYAGATAAIIANVVLVGYVIVAMMEDQSEAFEAAEKEKKGL